MNSRRFINFSPLGHVTCRLAFVSRLDASMVHPLPDFHDALSCRNAKSPASAEAGLFVYYLRLSFGSSEPSLSRLLAGFFAPPLWTPPRSPARSLPSPRHL